MCAPDGNFALGMKVIQTTRIQSSPCERGTVMMTSIRGEIWVVRRDVRDWSTINQSSVQNILVFACFFLLQVEVVVNKLGEYQNLQFSDNALLVN